MKAIYYRDPGDETDWDAATENRYEDQRSRLSTGLCERCKENEALPDDDWCGSCLSEFTDALTELDDAA